MFSFVCSSGAAHIISACGNSYTKAVKATTKQNKLYHGRQHAVRTLEEQLASAETIQSSTIDEDIAVRMHS